jgi:hypothetical protein
VEPLLQRTGALLAHRRWGLALLLAVFLAYILPRSLYEGTMWMDERWSILISLREPGEIASITQLDRHPPLYYLVLKAWNHALEAAGLGRGMRQSRLLNIPFALAMAAGAWLGLRRLLGARDGTLAAWMLVLAGAVHASSRDIRGYAIAQPCMVLCFVLLLLALERPSPRRAAALWLAYGLLAATALWTHLLASVVLLLNGLAWFGVLLWRREWRSPLAWMGGLAQAAAALSFVPWALRLADQLGTVSAGTMGWITRPTVLNFLRTPFVWFCAGPLDPTIPTQMAGEVLAAVGIVFATVVLQCLHRMERYTPEMGLLRRVAVIGLAVGLGNVFVLWMNSRLGTLMVFHGPRYAMFGAGPFAIGTAALLLLWVRLGGWDFRRALLTSGVWFAASLVGLAGIWRLDTAAFRRFRELSVMELYRQGRGPMYVAPAALVPYHRPLLEGLPWRPLTDMVAKAPPDDFMVLRLNGWAPVALPEDRMAAWTFSDQRIARFTHSYMLPSPGEIEFIATQVIGVNRDVLAKATATGFRILEPEFPPSAVARLAPSQLRPSDGWSFTEGDFSGVTKSWGRHSRVRLRFPHPVPPGVYRLRMEVFRHPAQSDRGTLLSVRAPDGSKALRHLAPGLTTVDAVVTLESGEAPVFELTHPTWQPSRRIAGSRDSRLLTIAVYRAWLEPAPP